MMNYINIFEICKNIAEELAENKSFNGFAQQAYGKNWSMEVGFDRFRQNWKKVAPFAVILPINEKINNAGLTTYETLFFLGVFDDMKNTDSVTHMQGLEFLSTLAVPALVSGVGKAADSINGLNFTDFECEYDQESFPLIYCNIALTLTMSTAIGGRRK